MTAKSTSDAKSALSATKQTEAALCHHINGRGHRCRMVRAPKDELCAHHAQRLSRSGPGHEAIVAELLASIKDFSTAASINTFLGNIARQLVRQRIKRRDAIALAYLSQLLLNSLSAMGREDDREQEAEHEQAQPRQIIWDFGPKWEAAKQAALQRAAEETVAAERQSARALIDAAPADA